MVRNIVENHVVAFSTFSEILFRVINYVIRAERSDKIDISGAANASDIGAESFRDLHRECAHASRRAVNQDLLTRLDFSFVAKSLQRRDARYVYRSCLLKREIGRLQRDCALGAPTYILGKSPASSAENIIAWFELGHILADGFNCPRKIDTKLYVLWFAQADPHHAHAVSFAFDEMPVVWINGRRANSDQELIVIRRRLFNVLEFEIG